MQQFAENIYRFCTQECWYKWLKDVRPNQSIIQFGSPNTPAIEPRPSHNEIPPNKTDVYKFVFYSILCHPFAHPP
jgi:hypothetical protein